MKQPTHFHFFGCSYENDFLMNFPMIWSLGSLKLGIYQMNKEAVQNLWEQDEEGQIELEIDVKYFNFQWAELAPPSGVIAANYSR